MSVIIKGSKGNPIIEIGDYQIFPDAVDGDYGGHWITRADPPAEGEGMVVRADDLVKLLNDYYEKTF